jgi:hypothetical protein
VGKLVPLPNGLSDSLREGLFVLINGNEGDEGKGLPELSMLYETVALTTCYTATVYGLLRERE